MADDQNGVSLNIDSNTGGNPLPEGQKSSLPVVPEMPSVVATEPVFNPNSESNVQNQVSAEPKAKTLYSSDDPNNNQVDLSKAGFDLNIEQKVPATEAEMNGSGGDIVDKIVSNATENKNQEDKILKELEQMDSQLELDVPIAPLAEKKVKTARSIFFAVLLTAIVVLAYLFVNPANGTASLSRSTFDPLYDQKEDLATSRSKLISTHYFVANTALKNAAANTAKYAIDYDISQSAFSEYNQKINAQKNLKSYRDQIQSALRLAEKQIQEASKLLLEDTDAPSDLLLYLSKKDSETADLIDKQRYQEAMGLYRNSEILGSIKKFNFSAQDQEFLDQLQPIMASMNYIDTSKIANVQTKRISWSKVISELERITNTVDANNNITYNGYTFDSEQNRVSVTGQIQTEDEKTFTLITFLIDSLNSPESPFANASNTSFSKNQSTENGFTSSIRLDFNLK